jgi:predicted protein tyrosine phosphatase
MLKLLFVCSQNRLRSPTAEHVFAQWPGVETASCGTNADAQTPASPELLHWADIIFVMEPTHRSKLQKRFRPAAGGKRIICLGIPDEYDYMQDELVALLTAKVAQFLPPAAR